MGNEVNEVINNICERFGIAANELIPEISEVKMTELGIVIGIAIVMLLAAGIVEILRRINLKRGYWYDEEWVVVIEIFLTILAILILAVTVPCFVGWIISPKAKVFELVFDQM